MTDVSQLTEHEDGWTLPLTGRRVTRCLVDFAFTLEFWIAGNDRASIRIGSPFDLVQEGRQVRFNPGTPTELGPVLRLFQKEVLRATASRRGSLEVAFIDGTLLCVPPSASYEAWEVSLEGGAMLVSQPGGAIAVWSSTNAEQTHSR